MVLSSIAPEYSFIPSLFSMHWSKNTFSTSHAKFIYFHSPIHFLVKTWSYHCNYLFICLSFPVSLSTPKTLKGMGCLKDTNKCLLKTLLKRVYYLELNLISYKACRIKQPRSCTVHLDSIIKELQRVLILFLFLLLVLLSPSWFLSSTSYCSYLSL